MSDSKVSGGSRLVSQTAMTGSKKTLQCYRPWEDVYKAATMELCDSVRCMRSAAGMRCRLHHVRHRATSAVARQHACARVTATIAS